MARDQRRSLIGDLEAASAPQRFVAFAKYLESHGFDLAEVPDIGTVTRLEGGQWETGMKVRQEDGTDKVEVVTQHRAAWVLSPKWEDGPEWPVVQPGPPVRVTARKPPKEKAASAGFHTAVVLPDMQCGYWRGADDKLHPTHDEQAIDVALQLTRLVNPDRVVLHGDNADFPELSRYRKHPTFAMTTQATVDRCTLLAGQLRSAAGPTAGIDWLAGNHEERLQHYIVDNARAAFGLKRGLSTPEDWPVLSMPELCRFADHHVTFHPGYPANVVWLNDRLRVIHGHKATKRSNAIAYLDESRVSTLFGHTHRREWAERTRDTEKGPRTILAASPGCLCRVDGVVPSASSGHDHNGEPIATTMDWQQGAAVVTYQPGDSDFSVELVPIHRSSGRVWAMHHGRLLEATVDLEGQPL